MGAALHYAALGYPVFPCRPRAKRPLTQHGFHDATTDPTRIEAWWTKHPGANIGLAIAGLLVVDIDGADNPWPGDPARAAELAQCPVNRTPRGGRHCLFRQPAGRLWASTTGKLALKVGTRADGGYIVVPPSVVGGKIYTWEGGAGLEVTREDLPEPSPWLIDLLEARSGSRSRRARGQRVPAAEPGSDALGKPVGGDLAAGGPSIPAGERNATLANYAGVMRHEGMTQREILAGLEQANLDRCQPPLPTAEVTRIVASIARDEPASGEIGSIAAQPAAEDRRPAPADPGPLPPDLLRVPGFVGEVMDHCLATAPYPNEVMAFTGALALQAVLAGRKVSGPGNSRTNLYLLGLAHSAAGKDHPRKLNQEILLEVGLGNLIGDHFASGEGLEDALYAEPCMLFQTDEIDGLLQSINKARDGRHESKMNSLQRLYSAANSAFAMRRKAGPGTAGAIQQPCLVLFGTAIPTHFYAALTERMLTNGFFARMIVLESWKRSRGQDPRPLSLPPRVLEAARWWADLPLRTDNLRAGRPEPRVVPVNEAAAAVFAEVRQEADAEYAVAEMEDDTVGMTVWGRVFENTHKFALIHAVSENREQPAIGEPAATWAQRLSMHLTRRMLFMAQANVAANPFDAQCLKFKENLRTAPGHEMSHTDLLRRMKLPAKFFHAVVGTLMEGGAIRKRSVRTGGRSRCVYSLTDR